MSPSRSPIRHRHRGGGRASRRALAVLGVLVAALLTTFAPAAGADTAPLPTCTAHTLQVRIADPGPASSTLFGQLCYAGPQVPGTVQLLVHGATYDHDYWDFPVGDGYYSYVRAATRVGYATFNVDRIGAGDSSHPESSQLDISAGAVALHDTITALRSGAVGGAAFSHVVYVGHSFGSIHGWVEASRYHDVDAMIVTGALHTFPPAALAASLAAIYPAVNDPRFADSGLDPGYITTRPGTRGPLFYYPATTDPQVVAADDASKDVATLAQLFQVLPMVQAPTPADAPSRQITVPVLVIVGENDALFCAPDCADRAAVQQAEAPFYAPEAHLHVVVIPRTGHDLALSTTAPVTDAVSLAWTLSVVSPT
jgi:pimeloyl-ACP methyl ester carboxylesterase